MRQPVQPSLCEAIVDDNTLTLNPSELAQPLPERVKKPRPIRGGRDPKIANPRHLRLLLRTHNHGASDRTTNKRNELPSPHAVLRGRVPALPSKPDVPG